MRVSFFSGLSMVAMAVFTAQGTQAIHINDGYGVDEMPMAATQTLSDIDIDADIDADVEADAEFFDALK